ncbi:hypothetical protein GCM10010400_08020 [Streptomyces aculeolatus]|uniref:hypothetical protein n=1 Tax=Streptomyces aculeolatus TaxID=270689 RepID=UPI001CED2D41|nr:hypothetical protein [Streptomyces aculeolatus]
MDGAASALIAVLGTLLGSTITYLFQRRSAERTEGFTRQQQLRTERMGVYSDFAGAVTEHRRSQYDRWHRKNEDPDGSAATEARLESYRLKGLAQHGLFRVQLIAGSPTVVEAARLAFDATSTLHDASDKAQLRAAGNEAKAVLERFITLASNDVR